MGRFWMAAVAATTFVGLSVDFVSAQNQAERRVGVTGVPPVCFASKSI